MKNEDIITHLFCHVDDRMKGVKKHPDSTLYSSELVTIGTLFALKGGRFRRFYRWLKREFSHLFPRLPDRTRLLRLLATHRLWTERFLAPVTFYTVVASYGIELIHPIRARSFGQTNREERQEQSALDRGGENVLDHQSGRGGGELAVEHSQCL
jgi:hypothetical protein